MNDRLKQLDAFHFHEAIDRSHIARELFESQVINHHVIDALNEDAPARQTAERISSLMGVLYQQLSELSEQQCSSGPKEALPPASLVEHACVTEKSASPHPPTSGMD